MRFYSLHFEKAISAALFVLLLVAVGMKNALAQTQVATLQHDEEMSAFYGMNALVEAHAAATDGDVITLSSGIFTSTTITKAITLNGAGCDADTLGFTPTFILGDFLINVSNDSTYLTIEGICIKGHIGINSDLYYAKIIKCQFDGLNGITGATWGGFSVYDVQFINCIINGNAVIRAYNSSASFINCVIASLRHSESWYFSPLPSTFVNVYNSVIGEIDAYNNHNIPGNLNLYNCVVGANSRNVPIIDSYAYNCIEIDTVFSSSVQAFNCMIVDSYSDVFESFDGTFSADANFHLNDNIATTFLGNDGREVGIYGGAMPYNPRPSYMILNRCNVANRSTIDGKLSVDIEVITTNE